MRDNVDTTICARSEVNLLLPVYFKACYGVLEQCVRKLLPTDELKHVLTNPDPLLNNSPRRDEVVRAALIP